MLSLNWKMRNKPDVIKSLLVKSCELKIEAWFKRASPLLILHPRRMLHMECYIFRNNNNDIFETARPEFDCVTDRLSLFQFH